VETQESEKELRSSLETPRVGQSEPTLTLVGYLPSSVRVRPSSGLT
jgi:hypothetical protein